MEGEAEKLGLTVTDTELQNILKEGTNPMLLQTPFVNQQTGRFDLTSLQKFLADYKAQQANPQANAQLMEQYSVIYRYWTFIEKTLRQQTLAQKYQALLANCFLSNPIEAKMAFNEENEESKIQLAALPYTDVQDSEVKVEESGNQSLTVTNLTDQIIPAVRIFYKFYMEEEDAYVGGISYTAKITNLEAGGTQTVTPSHYMEGSSRIMMVRTYDTAE